MHPLSSDYFIRCTQPEGHDGPHALDEPESDDHQTVWNDDSPYSLPSATETAAQRLDALLLRACNNDEAYLLIGRISESLYMGAQERYA